LVSIWGWDGDGDSGLRGWMETGCLLQGRGTDRDDFETSCRDRGGDGDESCEDGWEWV